MADKNKTATSDHHPIRVLHIAFTMKPRGTETWLMNILRNIDRKKIQMDFVTVDGETGFYDEEIRSLGGTIYPLPTPADKPKFLKAFRELLKTEKYDIVHGHPYHFCGLLMREAHHAGVPVRITHSHTDRRENDREKSWIKSFYSHLMGKMIRQYSTHGFAASEKAAESLFGKKWQEDKRFQLMFCGVDFDRFDNKSNENPRKSLGIPPSGKVIAHVGGLYFEKNHDLILRLFSDIAASDLKAYLLLIGDGPLKKSLEDQAMRLGITDRVIFTGARDDVPNLLSASDLFIFPSLFEGLGLSLVEAQAAGLPCLIADTIPPEAIINPELITILSLDDDIGVWLEKARSLLKPENSNKENSLAKAKASVFSIDKNIADITEFYESVTRNA